MRGGAKRGAKPAGEDNTKVLSNVIRIDDERIQEHLGKIVHGSVEETLYALLDAEAGRICNAGRYERTEPQRAGHEFGTPPPRPQIIQQFSGLTYPINVNT